MSLVNTVLTSPKSSKSLEFWEGFVKGRGSTKFAVKRGCFEDMVWSTSFWRYKFSQENLSREKITQFPFASSCMLETPEANAYSCQIATSHIVFLDSASGCEPKCGSRTSWKQYRTWLKSLSWTLKICNYSTNFQMTPLFKWLLFLEWSHVVQSPCMKEWRNVQSLHGIFEYIKVPDGFLWKITD